MEPTAGDEIHRTFCWKIFAQVDFNIMISRNSLVLTAPKSVEVIAIHVANDTRNVLALIIDRARYLMWLIRDDDFRLSGGNHETFVSKDLSTGRMINYLERKIVVVIGFP
jgi:hypothetical protein